VEIAPRRDKNGTCWQWQVGVTNNLQKGYGQSAARRVASYDEITWLDRPMRNSFWWPYEEEVWSKELLRCVIRKNRKRGTYRTRASLAEHMGRDIEEQVYSLELKHELYSTLVRPRGHKFVLPNTRPCILRA
jgi:hypothetical protein